MTRSREIRSLNNAQQKPHMNSTFLRNSFKNQEDIVRNNELFNFIHVCGTSHSFLNLLLIRLLKIFLSTLNLKEWTKYFKKRKD